MVAVVAVSHRCAPSAFNCIDFYSNRLRIRWQAFHFIRLRFTINTVEFDDRRDAEDALRDLNGARLLGREIAVEWAKSEGRRTEPSDADSCFRCGGTGHWAKDCKEAPSRRDHRRGSPRRRHVTEIGP